MTKKELQVLRMADRGCGASYRAIARRDLYDIAKSLKERGLLFLRDRGEHRKVGRFLWRTTDAGKNIMKEQKS